MHAEQRCGAKNVKTAWPYGHSESHSFEMLEVSASLGVLGFSVLAGLRFSEPLPCFAGSICGAMSSRKLQLLYLRFDLFSSSSQF